MNKKIDLTKILKDCPSGTMFYSSVFGTVLVSIEDDLDYPIRLYKYRNKSTVTSCRLTKYGELYEYFDGECILFPSKNQRDCWSGLHIDKGPDFDDDNYINYLDDEDWRKEHVVYVNDTEYHIYEGD